MAMIFDDYKCSRWRFCSLGTTSGTANYVTEGPGSAWLLLCLRATQNHIAPMLTLAYVCYVTIGVASNGTRAPSTSNNSFFQLTS